jgi:hypothetical protein
MKSERNRRKHRLFTKENGFVALLVAFALVLALAADRRGMPQKWHAAIVGTVTPFGVCVYSVRVAWTRWSFWVALSILFAVHLFAIWIFYEYVLLNVKILGTIYSFPVAFVEAFVLLFAVKILEEKLTGKREYYKLT